MKILLTILTLLASPILLQAQTTTLFIVRHAEFDKSATNDDPPLNAEGKTRVLELKKVLANTPVKTVYATKVLRGRQTAELFAESNHLPITDYRLEDDEKLLLKNLTHDFSGQNVLLIAHSGNIIELLNAATASGNYAKFQFDGFSDFFIITLTDGKPGIVTKIKYGK